MKVKDTGFCVNQNSKTESSQIHHPKTPLGGNGMTFTEFSQTSKIEEQSYKKTPGVIDSTRRLLQEIISSSPHLNGDVQVIALETPEIHQNMDASYHKQLEIKLENQENGEETLRTQQWNKRRQSVTIQVTPVEGGTSCVAGGTLIIQSPEITKS